MTPSVTPMYKNHYVPPTLSTPRDIHLLTPPEEYDFNFCVTTQPIKVLEGPGRDVRLEPLVPSVYAKALYEETKAHPELAQYMTFDPWQSTEDVLVMIEEVFRLAPDKLMYAIIDLKTDQLAGMIGYVSTIPGYLTTEIGSVFLLPRAQRTHVLTHSVSLLLDHAFNLPADGGLGMRRVQWLAHGFNLPSKIAALRLGFKLETESPMRMERTVLAGKPSIAPGRPGDGLDRESRDTWFLSITYIEWEEKGIKEKVQALVERKPVVA